MKQLLRSIELRRFGKRVDCELPPETFDVPWNSETSKVVNKLAIRFAVYFDETTDRQTGNSILQLNARAAAEIRWWLSHNVSGKYSIQSSYVFFEDEEDAMLCRLAFA